MRHPGWFVVVLAGCSGGGGSGHPDGAAVDAPVGDAPAGSTPDAAPVDGGRDARAGDASIDGRGADAAIDGGTGAEAQSGTRLRLRRIEGLGRFSEYGQRDVALGADCFFERAADGRWRCLPVLSRRNEFDLYADDACQRAAFRVTP